MPYLIYHFQDSNFLKVSLSSNVVLHLQDALIGALVVQDGKM